MAQLNFMKWLVDKVNIYYKEMSSDSFGGTKQVWTRKYNQIPARIYSLAISRGIMYIEESGTSYAVVQQLAVDEKVIINKGDKITHESGNFIVLQVGTAKGARAHHKEVLLGRMDE